MVSSIRSVFYEILHCIYVCTHRLEHSNQQKYLCLGYITVVNIVSIMVFYCFFGLF